MARPATLTDYKRATIFDAIGALAMGSYTVMSFLGPVPFWAQVAYLIGAFAGGASALILRNYFSLGCFVIVLVCALPQIIFST